MTRRPTGDRASRATGDYSSPEELVLSGEFLKQGMEFPWSWQMRLFEVTRDHNKRVFVSWYKSNEVDDVEKKGTLEINDVRLPEGSYLGGGGIFAGLVSSNFVRDLTFSPRAGVVEFVCVDGKRVLRAQASCAGECKHWLDQTRPLFKK